MEDLRWRERFISYQKCVLLLEKYGCNYTLNELERAGVVQMYEMTVELAWKLIKDYLETQEMYVKTPRDAVKEAFRVEIIRDADLWLKALQDRNLTSHTYEEIVVDELVRSVRERFLPMFGELRDWFQNK